MAELKRKVAGRKSGIRHALTVEQQKAFVDYMSGKPELARWNNLFVFLLGTGCRIGEAIGIRWDDVDFEKRVISINHNITYYPRTDKSYKCEFALSLPKTEAGIREIPMLPSVRDALQNELAFQKETGLCCGYEIEGMSNFIFFNRFYSIHNPQGVNRAMKRICQAYNNEEVINAKREKREPVILPNFSCHHLRHTFCSRLCENETNVKLIQEIMGHKDIQTTLDIYAEITGSKKQEAFDKLADKLDFF
jgi:integrase